MDQHPPPDVPAGHTFVGYTPDGKTITATTRVVIDDAVLEADEEYARKCREHHAAEVAKHGSEEAYYAHKAAQTRLLRRARRDAYAQQRITRVRALARRGGVAPTIASGRPKRRGAGRPRGQAVRSSARSGDSGDDSDGEHPPAVLRVRRPSGRTAVFEADGLEIDGTVVWATGRWRRHVGLNHADTRYSSPSVYGFGPGEILEVRA